MKAGYKTTEFWATVLFAVGAVVSALAGALPPKWAAVATAVAVGAYNIARGLSKVTPPKDGV